MNPLNKLHRNKRGGVSIVIGMVMAMTIVFSIVTNIFLWEQILHKEEQNRTAEGLTIDKIYTIANGTTYFQVTNIGTVTIRLVGLWINNTRHVIDYMLNPTEQMTISKNLGLTAESTFDVVIVTHRGLAVTSKYSPTLTPEVQATGVFKMNWFYFQYTSYQNSTKRDAGVIPSSNTYVALYLKVANNWIYPANITIETCVTWVVPYVEVNTYIVKNVSYPSRSITKFTEITIDPNEEKELVFAGETQGASGTGDSAWCWGSSIPYNLYYQNDDRIAALQVSLFYKLIKPSGTENHGQVLTAQCVKFPL